MKKILLIILWLLPLTLIIGLLIRKHFNKNKLENSDRDFTEQDAKEAIEAVKKRYGVERAKIIEKIMRAETAHFTSKQYKKTGSAGMLVSKAWGTEINKLPVVKINLKKSQNDAENMGTFASYYRFPSVTFFAYFLSDYIDRHNGDYLDWRSSVNQKYRNDYATLLSNIKNKFV